MSTIDYIDDLEAGELSIGFEGQEPQDLLEWALDRFAPRIAVSTAFQADGVALIDMVYELDPAIEIFSVDTGRLPGETFELIERLRDRYPGLNLQLVAPDARQIQAMVARHGPNLFYRQVEKRLLCCNVRKVQPLTAHLAGLDAWITGLRRDQWATRTDIRKVEIDHDHGAIVKLNPLAEWTEEEVWDYIRERAVPYHSLYDHGYTSIGCAPCTRALAPGEQSRDGRWWWEENAPKECGIHCAVETGGLEHELRALIGEEAALETKPSTTAKAKPPALVRGEVVTPRASASRSPGKPARLRSPRLRRCSPQAARPKSSSLRSTPARSSRRSRRSSTSSSSVCRADGSARSTVRAESRQRSASTAGCRAAPASTKRPAT